MKKQSNLKIVFCTASVGNGHNRAAEAVASFFKQSQIIDILDYVPFWFLKIYRDGYLFAVKNFPNFVGWCYKKTDKQIIKYSITKVITEKLEDFVSKRFIQMISSKDVDIIVSTHFLTSSILARLKKKQKLKIPVITIVTDNYPHSIWLHSDVDIICVANQISSVILQQKGFDQSKIRVTGIPVDLKFSSKQYKISKIKPTVLISGNGIDLIDLEIVTKHLLQMNELLKIVLVCGNNKKLFNMFKSSENKNFQVIGFTDKMHELMAQSDVIVCKPGGLTTAEALEINLPMVLLNPIPGQEEKNLKFLTELGVAFFASNSEDVYHYVKMITTNDKLRQRMKNNAKKISTGSASKIISQIVLEFFKNI